MEIERLAERPIVADEQEQGCPLDLGAGQHEPAVAAPRILPSTRPGPCRRDRLRRPSRRLRLRGEQTNVWTSGSASSRRSHRVEDAVGQGDGKVHAACPAAAACTARAQAGPPAGSSGAMRGSASFEAAAQEAAGRVHLPLVPRKGVRGPAHASAAPAMWSGSSRRPRRRCSTARARYGVGATAPSTIRASRTRPSATSRDAHAETTAKSPSQRRSFSKPLTRARAVAGTSMARRSRPVAARSRRARVESADGQGALPGQARDPDGRIQRDQHGGEVRRRHRLAAMRLQHGVIVPIVAEHRVARGGDAAPLVAIEAVAIEPAPLRLTEIAADRRHLPDLRGRDGGDGAAEDMIAGHLGPADEVRERDTCSRRRRSPAALCHTRLSAATRAEVDQAAGSFELLLDQRQEIRTAAERSSAPVSRQRGQRFGQAAGRSSPETRAGGEGRPGACPTGAARRERPAG